MTFGQVSPLWKTRLCEFWKARRLLHSVGLTELSGHKAPKSVKDNGDRRS